MEIFGVLYKIKEHDIKTGYSDVIIKSDKKYIHAIGYLYDYLRGTPLKLVGDYQNSIFKFTSARANAYSKEVALEVLKDKIYQGVGKIKSERIIDKYGSNFYEYYKDLSIKPDKAISTIITIAKYYTDFEDYIEEFSKKNIPFSLLKELYNDMGNESAEYIRKEPFSLMRYNLSFIVCDKLAKNLKVENYLNKKTKALVDYAIDISRSSGNTRISFDKLCDLIKNVRKTRNSKVDYFLIGSYVNQTYKIVEEDEDLYIYTKFDYMNEETIVNNLIRIETNKKKLSDNLRIKEIEDMFHTKYSKGQEACFNLLKNTGVKILTGGPGTGKTTIINGIITSYKMNYPDNKLLLVAPTGSAAKRMYDSTGIKASTIHSALGLTPFLTKEQLALNTKKLDCDFLIVDESSMIDTFIFACLLKAIKNDCLVAIVGDKDQLPSVASGNILSDMIMSNKFEYYQLTEIFRQKSGNSIIDNSKKVISGKYDLVEDDNFEIKYVNSDNEMLELAKKIAKEKYREISTDFKLFTPVKKSKYSYGIINMNKALRTIYRKTSFLEDGLEVRYGSNVYSVGDLVVFNRNTNKYYNGLEGVISDIQEVREKYYITIETEEENITISGNELKDISLNYSQTAHKSQGSECKDCIVLIPKEPVSMLKRQLLYVEITRAKRKVTIIAEGNKYNNSLKTCISSKGEFIRNTGLKTKLNKIIF